MFKKHNKATILKFQVFIDLLLIDYFPLHIKISVQNMYIYRRMRNIQERKSTNSQQSCENLSVLVACTYPSQRRIVTLKAYVSSHLQNGYLKKSE